jgi:DNA-binding NarL/FixJ family response regulator
MSAVSPLPDVPLRIVIADDQASVREGLVLLLDALPDIEVIGAAADGEQALALVAEHDPDAILLDLHMPVLDGIGATRRLAAEHPEVAVVVLTTYADDSTVLEALRAGARSYLTKDADRMDIARALHAAARGLSVLGPQVQATLLAATASLGQSPAGVSTGGTSADGTFPGGTSTGGTSAGGQAAAGPASAGTGTAPAGSDEPAGTRPVGPPPDGLTQREAEILALIASGLTNTEIATRLFLSNHTVKTHISRIFAKTGSRDRVAAIGYARRHNIG